jgi:S-methylmethionine-dependent homocysteine/selenocysteine methylase
MATGTAAQPSRPAGAGLVTDGGMETDLIFNRGVRLPDFAAFPLLADSAGRALLAEYYDEYAAIAASAGAGLLLESATWRANPDWGARLGYSADRLAWLNTEAIALLAELRDRYRASVDQIVISGMVGPRGDGYRPGARIDPDEAAEYHRPQVDAFAAAGADQVSALTLTDPGEAIGVTRAARAAGLPVTISFTVETDGRLPDGTTLAQAVTDVDAAAEPDYYLVNCAHPQHIAPALASPGDWRDRIHGVRYNASTRSHAELDEATDLDRGDLDLLAAGHQQIRPHLRQLRVLGGCCGTDARHVARLWQQG